jgi:uncharacterized RDD family membrane protein YckC
MGKEGLMSIREESHPAEAALRQEPAAWWRRGLGRLADVALWGAVVVVLAMFTGSDAEGAMTYPVWFYPALALVPIAYETATVRWRQGQSFGKTWTKTRVTTTAGEGVDLARATVRAAITWPFLVVATDDQLGVWVQLPAIIIYVAIFAFAVTNQRRRGLHDLAAGTVVVAAEE